MCFLHSPKLCFFASEEELHQLTRQGTVRVQLCQHRERPCGIVGYSWQSVVEICRWKMMENWEIVDTPTTHPNTATQDRPNNEVSRASGELVCLFVVSLPGRAWVYVGVS